MQKIRGNFSYRGNLALQPAETDAQNSLGGLIIDFPFEQTKKHVLSAQSVPENPTLARLQVAMAFLVGSVIAFGNLISTF